MGYLIADVNILPSYQTIITFQFWYSRRFT